MAALAFGNRRTGGWAEEFPLHLPRGNVIPPPGEIVVQKSNFVTEVPHRQLLTGHLALRWLKCKPDAAIAALRLCFHQVEVQQYECAGVAGNELHALHDTEYVVRLL